MSNTNVSQISRSIRQPPSLGYTYFDNLRGKRRPMGHYEKLRPREVRVLLCLKVIKPYIEHHLTFMRRISKSQTETWDANDSDEKALTRRFWPAGEIHGIPSPARAEPDFTPEHWRCHSVAFVGRNGC